MNRIKAVVFDLDNTLIDFFKMKEQCCESAVTAMVEAGLHLDEKTALEKLMKLYWKEGIESQNIFEKFLEKELGKVDYKILASGIAAYRRVKAGNLAPYPHVKSTLIRLKEKGLKLGIVSDAPRMQAWLRLAEMGLTDFFDEVVAFDDTGKTKPNEKPFKAIIQRLGLKAEEIIFVGDSPERDITGAKAVKMKAALAKYGESKYTKNSGIKPDFELKDLRDLIGIVEKS